MDTIFVNSENSKTVYSHIALLNLADNYIYKEVKKYCFIKSLHLLYLRKHKKFI